MICADSTRTGLPAHGVQGVRGLLCAGLVALLLACGGGSGSSESSGPPPTQAEASRFLAQASFGATESEIGALGAQGYPAWINDQFNRPQTLHRSYMEAMIPVLATSGATISASTFYESWWNQAVTGNDQLRQRVAFALSQIFVVSFADAALSGQPRGVASYYDMLARNAFGNYRTLLEEVTLHPMMGNYLSMLRNQKESATRLPDENYAREVMQLFSIGLFELDADGAIRMNASGVPIETYGPADISGLAKVFTGWSWYAGPNLGDRTSQRFNGGAANADRDWQPMQAYNRYTNNTDYHSISEKRFLGTTIASQSTPDPEGDLKTALDLLFSHPNTGPFIGKQLIQRLVTSNPSAAYVGRVGAAFANNGSGVRGDMKAVIRAVLLDPEARNFDPASTQFGKNREPVIRLANYLRAFNSRSTSGRFLGIDNTDDPGSRLSQTPMRSPTVFNFYRPGYTPPGTSLAAAGLVAPELQLAHEVSVAGYLNYMRGWVGPSSTRDVQQDFTAELALADSPETLVGRVNLLLMAGQMNDALRALIVAGVSGRSIPVPVTSAGVVTNQAAIDTARRDRVSIAVFLTLAAPDYLTQK